MEKYLLRRRGVFTFTGAFHTLLCYYTHIDTVAWQYYKRKMVMMFWHVQWHLAMRRHRNDTLEWCRMSKNWSILYLKYCRRLHVMHHWGIPQFVVMWKVPHMDPRPLHLPSGRRGCLFFQRKAERHRPRGWVSSPHTLTWTTLNLGSTYFLSNT